MSFHLTPETEMLQAPNKNRRRWKVRTACSAIALLAIALGLTAVCPSGLAAAPGTDRSVFETPSDGVCVLRPGDSRRLCEKLAVFQAKRAAVEAAEKYFSRRERIALFGRKKDEIINYTA
jgi:hypothetical protein